MASNAHSFITASQIRAARAILNWSQDELAGKSGLSVATIRKIEAGHISPRGKTNDDIRHAFENCGLEFIEPGGVRFRPEEIKIYRGKEQAKDFFDDVYNTMDKKGGDLIAVCSSEEKYFNEILGDYSSIHINRMKEIRAKISVSCILTEDKDNIPASPYCEYRWISKHYVNSVPFYVYDDKYAIIVCEADPSPKITVIQSQVVADAFRQQFDSMWEKATPLNRLESNDDAPKKKLAR